MQRSELPADCHTLSLRRRIVANGPLAGEQVYLEHLAAVPSDAVGSDDLIRAVVGTLDQNVRPNGLDQRQLCVLGE
jgi:hypothetical protein